MVEPSRDPNSNPQHQGAPGNFGPRKPEHMPSRFIGPYVQTEVMVDGPYLLTFDLPNQWREASFGPQAPKNLWMPPSSDAKIIVGSGILEHGVSIEAVAASPAIRFLKNGAEIPIVVNLPIIRADGEHAHMINFLAKIPGNFLARPASEKYTFIQQNTVLQRGRYWVSFESSSWGAQCNPADELRLMGRLHSEFKLK